MPYASNLRDETVRIKCWKEEKNFIDSAEGVGVNSREILDSQPAKTGLVSRMTE